MRLLRSEASSFLICRCMCPCKRSLSSSPLLSSPSYPLGEDFRNVSGCCGCCCCCRWGNWSIKAGLSGQSISWCVKIVLFIYFYFFGFFFFFVFFGCGATSTDHSDGPFLGVVAFAMTRSVGCWIKPSSHVGEVVPQGSNPFRTTSEGPSH